jgi:GNAT superfamily N-acetyltransferase
MRLHAIQACLRAGIADRADRIGPFLALFSSVSDNPFRNYAVPDDGVDPTPGEVANLVDAFQQLDRLPRLEYVRPAPTVDTALAVAGFDIMPTLGLMALAGFDEFTDAPDPDGYRVVLPITGEYLGEAAHVQDIAYGEPDVDPDPTGLAETLAKGGSVAVALHEDTDTVVGAGLFTPPQAGLVEIAGVGVLPEHWGRGLASAITARLTAFAMAREIDPFLQTERDEPKRIYEKLGYRTLGELADARLTAG